MSASASPNPTNLIILAVLGIGAYWFMTRTANARPVVVGPNGQRPSSTAQNIAAGIGAIAGLFGGGSGSGSRYISTGIYSPNASPAAVNWAAGVGNRDSDPDANGSVADWGRTLSSSGYDGLPINPVGVSPFDYVG